MLLPLKSIYFSAKPIAPLWRMGPRCSSAETQVCLRSYIIAASYTVCTTWLRLFLHEPSKYCDQSLSKSTTTVVPLASNLLSLCILSIMNTCKQNMTHYSSCKELNKIREKTMFKYRTSTIHRDWNTYHFQVPIYLALISRKKFNSKIV